MIYFVIGFKNQENSVNVTKILVINYFTLQAGHSVSVRVHFVIVSQSLPILSSQTVVCLCQQVIVKSHVRSEVQHSALGSQSILSAVCACVSLQCYSYNVNQNVTDLVYLVNSVII